MEPLKEEVILALINQFSAKDYLPVEIIVDTDDRGLVFQLENVDQTVKRMFEELSEENSVLELLIRPHQEQILARLKEKAKLIMMDYLL